MQLNLPEFDVRLDRTSEGVKVYDSLRRKWLVLTPEEWVRQHFVNYLVSEKDFPRELMANEISLRFNGMVRRCDTVVYDRNLRPLVIVEYKAPEIAITQKVFDQIARYNSVLNAPYLIVSNGMHHYCCRFDSSSGRYSFLREIPSYGELV